MADQAAAGFHQTGRVGKEYCTVRAAPAWIIGREMLADIAITQGTPIWAAIFVWELAQPPLWLLIVFAASATGAHGLHRLMVMTRADQKTTV